MRVRTVLLRVMMLAAGILWVGRAQAAEPPFSTLVGNVPVGEVTQTAPLQVPYITWGGDVATFYANGGVTTKPGSIFQTQGLNLKLAAGDNFVQQVRDYLSGKTPFLRGTFHMVGLASEVISEDPRTKGVCVLQMTWSVGDHMVARSEIKTVSDLKGKTIVLQQSGPHVGMLDDILKTAQLTWNDITVVWAKDLSGTPESPSEIFRTRKDVAACFAITPDMMGLTGGIQNVGSGAEGTVKGARVLVSTAELSRSIADVYVCRKDYYDAHKDEIAKFVAGYLKACEEVVDLKKAYESKGSPKYVELLKLTQSIYGPKIIPSPEVDAHGLICDCVFVGYPGNVAFFTGKNNPNGFEAFQKSALDLATSRGYAKNRTGVLPSGLDYESALFKGYLAKTDASKGDRFRPEAVAKEIEELSAGGSLDERTIVSFTINFEPNQTSFSAEQYGAEYQRVVDLTNKYGNAVIAVRGHADPTKTLLELVKSGISKGIIKQSGSQGSYSYSLNGKPLDLTRTAELVKLIESGAFDGVQDHNARETMQAALNLSLKRAEAVRDSVIEYAKTKGVQFDKTQIQPAGVGIREPFIAKPVSIAEASQNMRVEFRLMRVTAEAAIKSDFDF